MRGKLRSFQFWRWGAKGSGGCFFGGGEDDKGEESHGDGEGFPFSFAGGFEGEKGVEEVSLCSRNQV